MNFILFDGHCSKCNRFASFIEKRASNSQLNLHALESEKGKFILNQYGFPEAYQDSVVLIKDKKAYINSTAILYCIILLKKMVEIGLPGFSGTNLYKRLHIQANCKEKKKEGLRNLSIREKLFIKFN